jgi:uncharacterized protein (DUF362 family)
MGVAGSGGRAGLVAVHEVGVAVADEVVKRLKELDYLPGQRRVVVKPNVGNARDPATCTVTRPEVVEGVVRFLQGLGCEVVIAEGAIAGIDTMEAFAAAGYVELGARLGVPLIDLNLAERRSVPWRFGELEVPVLLEGAELVSVAKMKTHVQTGVTLGVKNLKGLISDEEKKRFHRDLGLHEPISELPRIFQPGLTLVDGVGGLEGDGPGVAGRVKRIRLLIMGRDPELVDAVALEVMGLGALRVGHLRERDLSGVTVVGRPIEEVRTAFRPPGRNYSRLNLRFWFNESCSGCNHNVAAAQRRLMRRPSFLPRFLWRALFGRIDVLCGNNPQLPLEYQRAICVGNCVKHYAKQHDLEYLKGCPPSEDQIVEFLERKIKDRG